MDNGRVAYETRYALLWNTPYRTGNLARNGVSDISSSDTGAYFEILNLGTWYGWLLNEFPTINHWKKNPVTGVKELTAYPNRHYMWLDKFMDNWANEFALLYPNYRRIL